MAIPQNSTLKHIMKMLLVVVLVVVLAGGVSHLVFASMARKSSMWRYAERALAKRAPDYDLRHCVDLEPKDRKDFSKSSWKPMPCINTATANYNSDFRAGNCAKFVQDPERWSFREVDADETVPGDLIIFFMNNGRARHAAVYTQDSILGPLCATTMYPKGGYYRYFPYRLCMLFTRCFGSFTTLKYYRYDAEIVPAEGV